MGLRIGFDATAAVHQSAGIGRYTRHLLEGLIQLAEDDQYRLCFCSRGPAQGALPALPVGTVVRSIPASDRIMNALWHRLRIPLPVQLATGACDIFHSPDFTLPPTGRTASVLTVHDLAFLTVPDCAVPSLAAYLSEVVPRSARRAKRVIAVSDTTRADVVNLLGIPEERVVTVPEAPSPAISRAENVAEARASLAKMGVPGPYILAVGTMEPRKNYARLFEAYSLLRERGAHHQLVVAGRPGWMYEQSLRRLGGLGLLPHVILLRPTDALLSCLYTLADVVVYPSLYEGFGIPPVEAMRCGAPVASSNTPALLETVGEAAVTFDPLSVEDMARAIEQVLSDEVVRDRLRAAGAARVGELSWRRTAIETRRVYAEAVLD